MTKPKQLTPHDSGRLADPKPVSVKFPKFFELQFAEAKEQLGFTDQQIIRLATFIGVAALAEIDYKIGDLIAKAALKNWEYVPELRPKPEPGVTLTPRGKSRGQQEKAG